MQLPNFDEIFIGFDKVVHIIFYFLIGISIQIMILGVFPKKPDKIIIILTLIIGLTIGTIDEIIQSFMPLRFSDIKDFIADFIGLSFSIFIYKIIKKILKS